VSPRLPGRPRAAAPRDGISTQEEILQASDRLFCAQGYGPTSTHAIAREARISQASLYHHFAGKQDVLLALLLRTVRPSADLAEELVAGGDGGGPAERLRQLCAYDVRLLVSGAENTGLLYSLPEVRAPFFAPFHAERRRLFEAYRALVSAARGAETTASGPEPDRRAAMVLSLVESVITRRLDGLGGVDEALPDQIADAALRLALDRPAH
jgi:AcrR family transcriptional regulator